MKLGKDQQKIILILMFGFLAGILYTNVIADEYVTITNVFHENYLNKYLIIDEVASEYVLHLFWQRMMPFFTICLLATTRYKRISAILFMIWTGFSTGVLAVTSVLSVGISGMLVCIAAMLPHYLFYGISYAVILYYCMADPAIRWNKTKTIVVGLMQISGVMAESYLNPWIMKIIIGILI